MPYGHEPYGKKPKKKKGLEDLTNQSLEDREKRLRGKLERTKSSMFDKKMILIQIEFDSKHPEIANKTLINKKSTLEHNLKANEKQVESLYKLLDEVTREHKRRTLKPTKNWPKLW